MTKNKDSDSTHTFEQSNPLSCRVETRGGTIYWLSAPENDGTRWVMREHLTSAVTNTMVMQPLNSTKEGLDLGDKFRARLGGDIVVGLPFVLEVCQRETRILSEVVVGIEVGNVPEMIFG